MRAKKSPSAPSWMNGMIIRQQDMPNIEVGVRSACLAEERARLIDGWRHRATMFIQSFIWTVPTWVERPKIERHRSWLEGYRSVVGWSRMPCRARVLSIAGSLEFVNDVIMSSVETLVMKSALMRELRSSEGCKVRPEESQVGASAADAVVEISAWEMQSTATTSWSVEFPGQVVSRFQESVSDGKATYERRK